ncbi:hypothetical protein [Pseudoduganella violaceinigra]|uniref:hypothetical protein n=1 Tax=Pseudoduganella violaceinigra TaxID=246602 RepID=UPI0004834873|nr:hypothetical protein [Pseudoduganella violaceinigra]
MEWEAAPGGMHHAAGGRFLDWWFNPWLLARGGQAGEAGGAGGPLSVRLAYRRWCFENGVRPDFPTACDGAWQQFAVCDADVLGGAALAYGALLAAREGRHAVLAGLSPGQRRWSLGTAAIQPLSRLCLPGGSLQADGLRELACAMEAGFPGLWDRLRLLLPNEAADDAGAAVTEFVLQGQAPGDAAGAAARRRLRCWGLCLARAESLDLREEYA